MQQPPPTHESAPTAVPPPEDEESPDKVTPDEQTPGEQPPDEDPFSEFRAFAEYITSLPSPVKRELERELARQRFLRHTPDTLTAIPLALLSPEHRKLFNYQFSDEEEETPESVVLRPYKTRRRP